MKFSKPSLPLRAGCLLAALALSGVLCVTALAWPAPESETVSLNAEVTLPTQGTNENSAHILMLKDTGGMVGVYLNDSLLYKTDIPVISLPQQDREDLSQGIVVADETQLHQLLEDFGA